MTCSIMSLESLHKHVKLRSVGDAVQFGYSEFSCKFIVSPSEKKRNSFVKMSKNGGRGDLSSEQLRELKGYFCLRATNALVKNVDRNMLTQNESRMLQLADYTAKKWDGIDRSCE
jgi:hypothetical protein